MYCRGTKQWLKASAAERSDGASNYQGELLGTVVAQLILRAASVTLVTPLPTTALHCDNHGVISHSNSPLMSLPEKQKQSDLIRLIKYLAGTNNDRTSWEWVEGHAVERKGWRCSTLPKHLNDQSNKLAKKSLIHAIAGRHVMTGNFSFEVVGLKLLGKQVCGSPRRALEFDWGYCKAQTLFLDNDIVHKEDFTII
jgi:hypothetical protein